MGETKTASLLEDIRVVVERIVELFKPYRVILFGSQVTGKATEESDVDLLVVMDIGEAKPFEVVRKIKETVGAPKRKWMGKEVSVWLDIHVFSPEEFEERLLRKSVFLTAAVSEGMVLYEAPGVVSLGELLSRQRDWEGDRMKPETKEWVDKAEEDWAIAQRLLQPPPFYDDVCFHAQQCAEKYLKAFLEERNIVFPKTHKLTELLDLSGGQLSELEPLRGELEKLSEYVVIPRYVGFRASREDAEEALKIAEKVRSIVRAKLGKIPDEPKPK